MGELHGLLQCSRLDFHEDALPFKETSELTSTPRSFKRTFSFHLSAKYQKKYVYQTQQQSWITFYTNSLEFFRSSGDSVHVPVPICSQRHWDATTGAAPLTAIKKFNLAHPDYPRGWQMQAQLALYLKQNLEQKIATKNLTELGIKN